VRAFVLAPALVVGAMAFATCLLAVTAIGWALEARAT